MYDIVFKPAVRLAPYTVYGKLSRGKTFAVFAVFQSIAKVFPLNHMLCIVHDGHSLMHHKVFQCILHTTAKVLSLEIFAVYDNHFHSRMHVYTYVCVSVCVHPRGHK